MGELSQQVDEWLELQQQSLVDLVTSAEATYKKLCVELDATTAALDAQQHRLPKPPARPPAPVEVRRPAAYPTLDDQYPNIARVAALRLQRLSESRESCSSEPPKPKPVPITVAPRLVLRPSPLVMTTLRHILLRSSLTEMRAALHVRRRCTLAQQRVAQAKLARAQAGAMQRWQLGCRLPVLEPAAHQAAPALRRAWRAWQLWANDRRRGERGGAVLRPCRARCALSSWRGAASERASSKARMDVAAQLATRRSDAAALRQWRVWGRRAQQWQRRAEHRARAAGGAHLQHLPSMRAFDARATFVEAGSAEMANAYRRRRMMAVTFGRWLGGMHLPGPQEEPEGLAEEPRPADLFVRQATVQHV